MRQLKLIFVLSWILFHFMNVQATDYTPTYTEYEDFIGTLKKDEGSYFKNYYMKVQTGDVISFDYSYLVYNNAYGGDFYVKINDQKVFSCDTYNTLKEGSFSYLCKSDGIYKMTVQWNAYYYYQGSAKLTNIQLAHSYEPTVNKPDVVKVVGEDTSYSTYSNIGAISYFTYQAIYTPLEVGSDGIINEIAFQREDNKEDSKYLNIYMGHKFESSFASTSDYLPYSDMELVFSGRKTASNYNLGWDVIKLDTPFEYDGERNLVVIVCHASKDGINSHYYCTKSENKVLYRYDNSDHSNISGMGIPSNYTYSYSMLNYRINTKFSLNCGTKTGIHYTGNGLTYALYKDNTARLIDGTGYTGNSLSIPESIEDNGVRYLVTTICENALAGNKAISIVEIASSITYIEPNAFKGCTKLQDLVLKDGKKAIECDESAFEGSDLISLYIGRNVIGACFSNLLSLEDIRYGNNVTYIPICAFQNCSNIKKLNLKNIEYISANAFMNCISLVEVEVGKELQYLGTYSFANCQSLQDYHVEWEHPLDIRDNTFDSNNMKKAILHVPTGTKEQYKATDVWKDFGTIVDVAPVQMNYTSSNGSIINLDDENAFDGEIIYNKYQNGVGTILFGGELTTIGRSAFAECTTLTSADVPKSVTLIDRYAFQDCESLASIILPSGLERIEKYAFLGCEALENVSVYALVPPTIYSSTFEDYGTLHVMEGYKEVYAAADYWKNFTIIDDLTEEIGTLFADGITYAESKSKIVEELVYTRTFSSADKWQAFYVPFSIPVDVLTENGLEVAELNNIHMYDTDGDKQFDKTTLEFLYLTEGETQANYPYLIKSANEGNIAVSLKNAVLYAAVEKIIECATTRQVFKIKGTYSGVSGADMQRYNYYAMGDGSLVRVGNSTDDLKPQRWYMSIENKDGTPVDYYAPKMRIMVNGMEVDENETGIQEISAKEVIDTTIYTLDGRTMNSTEVLKSGIYIKKRQKMIVR